MNKVLKYIYTAFGIGGMVASVVAVMGGDADLGTYDLVLAMIMFWLAEKEERRSSGVG